MKEWFQNHTDEVIGIVVGLVIAILFLLFGFFKTLFLIVLAALGGVIGHYWPLLERLRDK